MLESGAQGAQTPLPPPLQRAGGVGCTWCFWYFVCILTYYNVHTFPPTLLLLPSADKITQSIVCGAVYVKEASPPRDVKLAKDGRTTGREADQRRHDILSQEG